MVPLPCHVHHIGIFFGSCCNHCYRMPSIVLFLAAIHWSHCQRNMYWRPWIFLLQWNCICLDRCHDSVHPCSYYLEVADAENTATCCYKHSSTRWLVRESLYRWALNCPKANLRMLVSASPELFASFFCTGIPTPRTHLGPLLRYLCGLVSNLSLELSALAFPPLRRCSAAGGLPWVAKDQTQRRDKTTRTQADRGYINQGMERLTRMMGVTSMAMKCNWWTSLDGPWTSCEGRKVETTWHQTLRSRSKKRLKSLGINHICQF